MHRNGNAIPAAFGLVAGGHTWITLNLAKTVYDNVLAAGCLRSESETNQKIDQQIKFNLSIRCQWDIQLEKKQTFKIRSI